MKNCNFLIISLVVFTSNCSCSMTSPLPDAPIRMNQIGFYPDGPKIAAVIGGEHELFYITSPDLADTVYSGTLSPPRTWPYSEESVQIADFSTLQEMGEFVLTVPGLPQSYVFEIKDAVHKEVAKAALKAFYFQRISTPLPEQYAGKWHRPAGHPQDADQVLVHASAATEERPEGTKISSPLGWYDAGDFNKYIVNSGITTYSLLALYEDFPEFARGLEINIPESGNDIPDVLDEALWNLRWMLTMQDPNDGGVYHKLTHASFSGMIMPHEATAERYVIQKSTTAALNFAAVMAQAGRIFKDFESQLPGLADSCTAAALEAWRWARQNPALLYNQRSMNSNYSPEIRTGAYGDRNANDEFAWAAAEIYRTTGHDSMYAAVKALTDLEMRVPSWPQTALLGYYSLRSCQDRLNADDAKKMNQQFIRLAETIKSEMSNSAYNIVMGQTERDFRWGSNAIAANQGIVMIQAYRLTGDDEFLKAAIANLDYLLGRNATGYSFMTGFGAKTPMHPHHRQSQADGIADPIPGLLVGGPAAGHPEGDIGYPTKIPARSYLDNVRSYSTNENAINWNAAMVYFTAAIEAIMKDRTAYTKKQ